jgi:hypothetical protein
MEELKEKSKRMLEITAEEFKELGGEIMNRFPGRSSQKFQRRWASHLLSIPLSWLMCGIAFK